MTSSSGYRRLIRNLRRDLAGVVWDALLVACERAGGPVCTCRVHELIEETGALVRSNTTRLLAAPSWRTVDAQLEAFAAIGQAVRECGEYGQIVWLPVEERIG